MDRKDIENRVSDLLEHGTLNWNASQFLRQSVLGSIASGGGLAVLLLLVKGPFWAILGLFLGVFMAAAVFVFVLTYSPYQKAQEIESLLPEVLEILSSNLQAGLTTREALKLVVEDQYEPLASEISHALAKESMGATLTDALLETTERVESEVYGKVMQSLARGIESGANVEEVTRALARNIQDIRNIRESVRTAAMGYTAFLTFASLIAAPFLFALSTFLIKTMSRLMEQTAAGAGGGNIPTSFLSISTSIPPVDLLSNFFLAVMAVTALSTAVGIGIVTKGHTIEGLKIAPFFITIALLVYWIGGRVIGAVIGGVI